MFLRFFWRINQFVWIILILILTVLNIWMTFYYKKDIYDQYQRIPKSEMVLVLGASVKKSKRPSQVLIQRLDKAIELYDQRKVDKLLISGDDSGKYYNEVKAMKNYALAKNVDSNDIFLDHQGLRTFSSIYHSKHYFNANSVIIVTQEFHLSRALFLAEQIGLKAYGYAADHDHKSQKSFLNIREFFARYLAIFDIARFYATKNQ